MTIRLQCEDCGSKIKAPEGAEGRRIKCPRCGAILRAPTQSNDSQDTHALETESAESESALDSLAAVSEISDSEMSDSEISDSEMSDSDIDENPQSDELDEFEEEEEEEEEEEAEEEEEEDTDFEESFEDDQEIEEEGEDEEGGDEDEEEDPLTSLAAMSDTEDLEEDDDLDAEDENPLDNLLDEADEDPVESEPAFPSPSGISDEPSGTAPQPTIPLARPKPTPQPVTKSGTAVPPSPRTTTDPEHGGKPSSAQAASHPIPLSSRPSTRRPKPVPIPLGDLTHPTAKAGPVVTKRSSLTQLSVLGWALRVMAFLSVGASIKLMLVAGRLEWPLMERVFLLMVGLTAATVVWAVGEIAFVVKHLANQAGD